MKTRIQLDTPHIVAIIVGLIGVVGPVALHAISPNAIVVLATVLGAISQVTAIATALISNSISQPAPALPAAPSAIAPVVDAAKKVAVTILLLGFGSVFCGSQQGCTAAQIAKIDSALNFVDHTCEQAVLVSSSIPVGTPVGPVALDVELVCDIDEAATPIIEADIALLEKSEAASPDAGPVGAYVPSHLVLEARAHKAAQKACNFL